MAKIIFNFAKIILKNLHSLTELTLRKVVERSSGAHELLLGDLHARSGVAIQPSPGHVVQPHVRKPSHLPTLGPTANWNSKFKI